MTTAQRFSFWNGWHATPRTKQPDLQRDIMSVLGIDSEIAFNIRRRGGVEPKVTEGEAIEAVFAKYGVTPKEVWGGTAKSIK